MKYLKLFENYNNILPNPVEFTEKDKVAEIIIKSDSNVELKQEDGQYGEVYFEIEGFGKMMLGNFEWNESGEYFADHYKDGIQDMVYWWKGINSELNGKYKITELLSEFILDKLNK